MSHRKRRLNKRAKILLIALLILLVIGVMTLYFIKRPNIIFYHSEIDLEIASSGFDEKAQIKKIRKGSIEDVTIDLSRIDFSHLGTYQAIYTFQERDYPLTIHIIDTQAPQFELITGQTDANVPLSPESLVKNIVDHTKTTITFKKDYDFSQEGEQEVTVIVTDEAGNSNEKTTKITVLPKDVIAPVIDSDEESIIQTDATFDPMQNIEITDNQDPSPQLTVKSNDVDTSMPGTYSVVYEGKDRSGNSTTYTRTITVVPRTIIGQDYSNGQNIIYLTFDDGPSCNTPKILEILDRYQVKATFFVTGNNQAYNDYILQAYQAGHTIGLHTYSHDYSKIYSSKRAYFKDLKKIDEMVKSITGHHSHYIRFPGGSSNVVSKQYTKGIMHELSKDVIDHGYQYYDWNVSSSDASGNNVDTDKIITSATNETNGNLVILFHDTALKDTTVEALPTIIEYYQKLGFKFQAITDESYTCHHAIAN